jgi:hypothetical protein
MLDNVTSYLVPPITRADLTRPLTKPIGDNLTQFLRRTEPATLFQ